MADLPRVTGPEAIRAFERAGFSRVRQRGSHVVLKKPGHPYLLSVPDHGSKPLGVGLLRSLIRAAGLTVDEFVALL